MWTDLSCLGIVDACSIVFFFPQKIWGPRVMNLGIPSVTLCLYKMNYIKNLLLFDVIIVQHMEPLSMVERCLKSGLVKVVITLRVHDLQHR